MAKIWRLNPDYAKKIGLTTLIVADELDRKDNQVLLKGRGDISLKPGVCSVCGNSTLGKIHTPCALEFLDRFNPQSAINREQIRKALESMTFEGWFPLHQVTGIFPTNLRINTGARNIVINPIQVELVTQSSISVSGQKLPEALVDELKKRFPCRITQEGKKIVLPYSAASISVLQKHKVPMSSEILKIKPAQVPIKEIEDGLKAVMRLDLFPYQIEGVHRIRNNGGRLLLGDEQGLGKTAQAIGYMALNPECYPVLVVCPSVVKWNWFDEIKKFMKNPPRVEVLSGRTPYHLNQNTQVFIANPDILAAWEPVFRKKELGLLIVDEAHGFKSNKAIKTKALKAIIKQCYARIIMTGTPVLNRPMEIWNMVEFSAPGHLGRYKDFELKYLDKYRGNRLSAKKAKELHNALSDCMIRRLKKDVLKDLPPKIRSTISLHVQDRSPIEEARKAAQTWIKLNPDNPAGRMVMMGKLIQACSEVKLHLAIEWVDNLLETTDKVVVMCVYKKTIDSLMNHYGASAVKIDGSITGIKRNEAVKAFQTDHNIKVIICQIEAAGVGITLTASHNTVFVEYLFSAGKMVQAEDRIHRVGQKDMVNIWYLVVNDSIEERVIQILNQKMAMINAIVDDNKNDDVLVSKDIADVLRDWIV